MRRSVRLSLALIPILAGTTRGNPGVFVHKIDDTVVAGELAGVADGRLTVLVKGAKTVVPLAEVTQVVTTEQHQAAAPATQQAAAPTPQRHKGGGLLSALFGGSSDDDDDNMPPPPPPAANPLPAGPPAAKPLPPPTSRPAGEVVWQLTLTDGDALHAKVLTWAAQKLTVRPTNLPGQATIDVPSDTVTEAWAGSPEAVAKARTVTVPPGADDVAYVQKDADVVAVHGWVTGIDRDSLAFRYDEQDRKIGLNRLVGVVLRGNPRVQDRGFHQVVRTTAGDVLSGEWVGLGGKGGSDATLRLTSGSTVSVPFTMVLGIDCVSGRQVWLSSLTPAAVEQTPYFGRVMGYKLDQGLAGGPITLQDGPHAHGIAVHSRCVLTYDLGAAGGFDRLKTTLGFEQPAGKLGRVAARVVGDGKVLWENPDARGDAPVVPIDVPVAGVKRLVLDVDFGQGQDVGDRAIWADPRLLRATVGKRE